MNIKSFYSLTKRCPKLLYKFGISSRYHHSLISKENFHLSSRYMPIWILKHSRALLHLHSHAANQEKLLKESQNMIEVPPLQFKDIPFDQAVSHEELIAALQKYDSLSDQMECLVETLSLSPEDVKKREEFCKTIELLFRPFFNDFRIQMFGSTVNNFGFKGCDIDMTFETSAKHKDMTYYLERPDVPLVSEVLSGKVSRQELSELPLKEQLVFIHSVFLEHYKDSEVPARFINAHVPLVRFYHDRYNLKCDLTMKNRVAYANTKLLYLFSKLDKRVIPLMMTLRYWAKHAELIGKGLMYNTYTISLLVIYFLQTRSPPILPSAEFVLSLSDKFDTDDMNDRSFLDLISSIPPTKNDQSLEELLKEFFFFYLYFDFTRVICPLTASAIPRDDFFSKEENNRFRMNSMCVQDPLSLSHNVAELVDYKHCRKFFTEIMSICKIFQNESNNSSTTNKLNLITLLDKPNEYSFRRVSDEKALLFTTPLLSKDDKSSIEQKVLSSSETVLHILEHVLLFDCQTLENQQIVHLLKKQDDLVAQQKKELQERSLYKFRIEEAIPHLKNRRKKYSSDDTKEGTDFEELSEQPLLEQFQNFNANQKLILCAQCKVSNNTWLGRDMVDLDDLSSNNILVQEQLISKYVAKQNALTFTEHKVRPFWFLFECYTSSENSQELIVNFRPLQRMSFNPILGIFLKEYIPKIMKKIDC